MKKSSIITLLLVVLVPTFCYIILKHFSDNNVTVPRKLLVEDVVEKEKNGKKVYDTIWHKTPNFKLLNQFGDTVELYKIKNKIIVIDLFFTHCASICPKLTQSMKKMQESFKIGGSSRLKLDTSVVQFLSITIDPESDSVQQLRSYANRYNINPDNWHFLTGNRDSIYNFIFEGLKLGDFRDAEIDPTFAHTDRFVLLDANYIMRGRLEAPYNGLDTASMSRLSRDIGLIMLEKDKTKKSTIFTQMLSLTWLWILIVLCVFVFIWIMNSKREKH